MYRDTGIPVFLLFGRPINILTLAGKSVKPVDVKLVLRCTGGYKNGRF